MRSRVIVFSRQKTGGYFPVLCLFVVILFLATCFLAYSNGANDNFKGVATLFGSGATNYKTAIWWATLTTFGGSVCSVFFAESLVKSFSGMVPTTIAAILSDSVYWVLNMM